MSISSSNMQPLSQPISQPLSQPLSQQKFEDFDDQTEKTVAEWFFLTTKPTFKNEYDLVNNRRIFRAFDVVTIKDTFNKYFNSINDTKVDLQPLSLIEYIKTLSKFTGNDPWLNNYINEISYNYLKLMVKQKYNIKDIPQSEFFVGPLSLIVKNLGRNWAGVVINEIDSVQYTINKLCKLIKLSNSSELMKCQYDIKSIAVRIDKIITYANNDVPLRSFYKDFSDLNNQIIEKHAKLMKIMENHHDYYKNVELKID